MNLIKLNKRNSLLDELFSDNFFDEFLPSIQSNTPFIPLGDVIETENAYEVQLMLPAFNKNDFKIEIVNDSLVIEGERTVSTETKYNHKQSYFGKIKKTYSLPNDVDRDNIDAEYVDGVLKVIVPRLEEKVIKPKLISVK